MLSPQALIRGLVQRAWSPDQTDGANTDVAFRQFPKGEMATQPIVRKAHNLADEGSYFIINNAQTGITPPLGVGFVATVAALSIYNQDTLGRRMYLDYINLTNVIAVTATTSTVGAASAFMAIVIDNGNRFTSGGTPLPAPVNPNLVFSATTPNITTNFGNLLVTAATGAARTIVGERVTRPVPTTAALTLVGDTWLCNFGAVEQASAASLTITNPCTIPVPFPPIIIGPSQSALLYLWWANSTPAGGAAGFLPEIGFWMR